MEWPIAYSIGVFVQYNFVEPVKLANGHRRQYTKLHSSSLQYPSVSSTGNSKVLKGMLDPNKSGHLNAIVMGDSPPPPLTQLAKLVNDWACMGIIPHGK